MYDAFIIIKKNASLKGLAFIYRKETLYGHA